jgi:hypothetical protein
MTAEALVLFMKRVKINSITECWEWIGPIANSGYGRTYTNGRVQSAHRASYEHFIGNIGVIAFGAQLMEQVRTTWVSY